MPPSTISVATNATIHLLYQIASISYCSNASLTAFNCTPCLRSNSSVSDLRVFYSEKTDARAVTALVTPQGGKPFITLSWRGTETLENWIENLKFIKTDHDMSCKDCKVHSGFFDTWMSLQNATLREIQRLRTAHPTVPLVVTGHSLGGAVATLGSYILHNDLKVPVDATYTYGSPRVGNQEFALAVHNRSGSEWRVTHHRDIVPHLPPDIWLLGFKHTAREVFYRADDLVGRICNDSGEDESCADQYGPMLSVSDHLHYFGETIGEVGCGPGMGSWLESKASRVAANSSSAR